MKSFRFATLRQLILACASFAPIAMAFIAGSGPGASAVSAAPAPQVQVLPCSSDDMRRHWCPADTRGGVELIKQRSEAKCIFDRTWGYDVLRVR